MFARSDAWWDTRAIADPEYRREPGEGPKRFALYELDGDVRGYAIYRHKPGFLDGVSSAELVVVEAVGAGDEATREVWRFLLDIDWAATVTADFLPPDHPLFLLLAEPRRLRYKLYDALWVRLVDVGAALSQRMYGDGAPLVFEVSDEFCPWNDGHWRLADGKLERTDEEPDVRLGAAALGSAHLRGVGLAPVAGAS